MISDIQHLPGLGLSDHVCLKFVLTCYGKYIHDNKPRYNLHQADFDRMRTLLEAIDWDDTLSSLDIHQAWDVFASHYESILKECIPCHALKMKKKNIYMTREAFRIKKKKCKLWKQYKLSGTKTDYSLYSKARNELRSLTRSLRKSYEEKIASNIKTNQKVFWKYVNSRLKSKSSINCLQHADGSMTHSNTEMANVFNNHFASVYTREDISSVPSFHLDHTVPTLNDVDITPSIVLDRLEKINVNKSSGPDGWPLLSLKETALQLSVPLCILFKKSLSSSCLPSSWKHAHVTPIHKKGNRSAADNYRPISLTSPIVRILESIIKDHITHHMLTNSLFSPSQHGFIAGRSCTTQLLTAMDYWTQSLNDGYPVDIIYLDFRKAFDSVPHNRLLMKLKAYGMGGSLLRWVQNFLSGRRQRVVLNGDHSSWSTVSSGVPQGSVLGPMLFLLYVNDIPLSVDSSILLFADDAKIFRSIRCEADYLQLQRDIDILFEWSRTWLLNFNISKCYVLHLGLTHSYGNYCIDGNVITSTESVKDLGIIVDSSLKFHNHTAIVTARANRILAVINKSFEYLNTNVLLQLYKSFVRPILEYGNIIWGPQFILDQQSVEKIQRRATKLVSEIKDLQYVDRLNHLNLPSLRYRRRRGDLIYTYRLFHNMLDMDSSSLFTLRSSSITRGHDLKIYKPHATCLPRRHFYSVRIINDWNGLPYDSVNVHSTNLFKTHLDRFYYDYQYDIV